MKSSSADGQPIDPDFVEYCRRCTDSQLEHVLQKEFKAFGQRDYGSAVQAAAERGWRVINGERQ